MVVSTKKCIVYSCKMDHTKSEDVLYLCKYNRKLKCNKMKIQARHKAKIHEHHLVENNWSIY
jgi:hypothetical protein